jgi:hypothetical protein
MSALSAVSTVCPECKPGQVVLHHTTGHDLQVPSYADTLSCTFASACAIRSPLVPDFVQVRSGFSANMSCTCVWWRPGHASLRAP